MVSSILSRIVQVLEAVSGIVLAAMMLLTFIDVIGRYILSAPIFGASEMISTLLALLIFLGLGIANARDKHIVVELFNEQARSLAPRLYDVLVQGFSILAMCLIVFVLSIQAMEAARVDSKTVVLEWPLVWITGTVAALAALSVVSQILGLVTGAGRSGEHHLEEF